MPDMRIALTEKAIALLPPAKEGQYKVRDSELKGFYVLVGKRHRTYMVQADLRRNGKRVSSIKVSVGDVIDLPLREAKTIAKAYLLEISRGRHPKAPKQPKEISGSNVTLRQAWDRYLESHLQRKGRAEQTIRDYRDHVGRLLAKWLDTPLASLADNPAAVADMHDQISKANGRIIANNSMRTLRAIYNHSRKRHRDMPAYNPTDAVDWNPQVRRNTAMGLPDLPAWFDQLRKLNNPIRREYHLFTLLSGSRPTALKEAKPEHLDARRRVLHIPRPKGGAKRAFDIPLSREMMLSLIRAIRLGRIMYPMQAGAWIFPSESEEGHLCEQKESRNRLAKWGNDLRQTYRTLAAAAGVSEIDARLLMNHAIQGVNAGYITRHKLLEDHLRFQQQAISTLIFSQLDSEGTAHQAKWWRYTRGALIEQAIRFDEAPRAAVMAEGARASDLMTEAA